ncbi:hypothetical protein R69746_08768 [Paraburkholderia aspalathi]|nr:hypothetical protein R69746_08768 [Paraburkholderia aspalathi]
MQRIGLARPRGQHLLAEHFGLIGLTRIPMGLGTAECRRNTQVCLVRWGRHKETNK